MKNFLAYFLVVIFFLILVLSSAGSIYAILRPNHKNLEKKEDESGGSYDTRKDGTGYFNFLVPTFFVAERSIIPRNSETVAVKFLSNRLIIPLVKLFRIFPGHKTVHQQ